MHELDTAHEETHSNPVQNPAQSSMQTDESTAKEVVGVRIPSLRVPMATYILLGIIVVIFIIEYIEDQMALSNRQFSMAARPFLASGIADFKLILRGEYIRLFLAMFFHLGLAHVAFNGYALWIAGQTIERFFGRLRYLVIYILGGLAGNILTFIFMQSGAGASGAIFALFGAEGVFVYRNRQIFGASAERHLRSLLIMLLINLGLGLYTYLDASAVRIGVVAHAGGFIAGIALAWFMGPHYQVVEDTTEPAGIRITDTTTTSRIQTMSAVATVLLAIMFFVALTIYRSTYR